MAHRPEAPSELMPCLAEPCCMRLLVLQLGSCDGGAAASLLAGLLARNPACLPDRAACASWCCSFQSGNVLLHALNPLSCSACCVPARAPSCAAAAWKQCPCPLVLCTVLACSFCKFSTVLHATVLLQCIDFLVFPPNHSSLSLRLFFRACLVPSTPTPRWLARVRSTVACDRFQIT